MSGFDASQNIVYVKGTVKMFGKAALEGCKEGFSKVSEWESI